MLVLTALMVPCGLLVLMMAMQQVQERLLPPGGPAPLRDLVVAADPPTTVFPVSAEPMIVVIPPQPSYDPSESVVGSASLTSASPSR